MSTQGTIFVIDDDPALREVLEEFLTGIGYSVITADNSFVGLEKIRENSIDLVITDLMMPGISGIDFIKAVREYDPDLPVIMITAYPSIDIAVNAIKEGASDFITKPFNLDHISLVVRRTIEEGRLKKQNRLLNDRVREIEKIKSITKNLQEKINELSALYTISETLHYPTSTEELFEKIVEIPITITQAKNAGLWLWDKNNGQVVLKAAKGMQGIPQGRLPLSKAGLVGRAFIERKAIYADDYRDCICQGVSSDFRHSFVCLPIMIGEEIFGALHVCQKITGSTFSSADIALMKNLVQKASLKLENIALYDNLIDNIMQSITSLIKAIDAKDNYTMNHCKRVTYYAIRLAQHLDCPQEVIDAIRIAGPIHDVGKIGIKDEILLKPGTLTETERKIMEKHVVIGEDIVKPLNFGSLERAVVRNHHERFNGKGYPDGLKASDIPLIARIFSVVDTYDAITTDRPYRPARPHEEATAELLRCSGTQFDRTIVEAFIYYKISKDEVRDICP